MTSFVLIRRQTLSGDHQLFVDMSDFLNYCIVSPIVETFRVHLELMAQHGIILGNIWGFPCIGISKNDWFKMENPTK